MSTPTDNNIATLSSQRYTFMIIVSAFSLGTGITVALLYVTAYFVTSRSEVLETAKDMLLIVVPVATLVIGSMFGFIAGRKS
jgi:hypothetical protein